MIGNGIILDSNYELCSKQRRKNCVARNCSHNTILRIENDVHTVSRSIF